MAGVEPVQAGRTRRRRTPMLLTSKGFQRQRLPRCAPLFVTVQPELRCRCSMEA